MRKGQASLEALLILAAVLFSVSTLYVNASALYNPVNVTETAKKGVQTSLTNLYSKYGTKAEIYSLTRDDNKITVELRVLGNPPPKNEVIENTVENFTQKNLESSGIRDYEIDIIVEKRVMP